MLLLLAAATGAPRFGRAADGADERSPADAAGPALSDDDAETDAAFADAAAVDSRVSARAPGALPSWLDPLDFAPPCETSADILARERALEVAWSNYFASLDGWVKSSDRAALDKFIRASRPDLLYLLATEYGYTALREPALARLREDFGRSIAAATRKLAPRGIADIGEAIDLGRALDAACTLRAAGAYTPELAAQAEALIAKYVDGKSVFWGFTRKFPYFLSGYNKEAIIMDLAASTKVLYEGTGKFRNTIDSFDAAWAQLSTQAYETDNSPHYDSSVNLHFVFRWVTRLHLAEDLKRAPHFRMILDRMARTVLANGESANYGKSMCRLTAQKVRGLNVDAMWVEGGGIGTCLRWAYRLYGDPQYLYLARKYELTSHGGRAPVNVMPRAYDLNYFDVKGATYGSNAPLAFTTLRLKGPGYALDRGVRRAEVQPVQDKLMLSTGSDPRAPSLLMDLSFTQSKAKDKRRMGIDNLLFNGAHLITVAGRPDNPEETNRIFLMPDDVAYPGTGGGADWRSRDKDPQAYVLKDYYATRLSSHLAYGEVEYARLQYEGVHAKRKLALLNNGVLVVEDTVWADEHYAGGKQAGAVYNVWSKVLERGTHWVITSPRIGHLPDGLMDDPLCALLYIAPAPGLTQGLNKDIDFYAHAPLGRERPLRIVSAVIPLPHATAVADGRRVGDGIRTDIDGAGNTSVLIPYSAGQTLRVLFPAGGFLPAHYALENNDGAPSLALCSYNRKYPANLVFTARRAVESVAVRGRELAAGAEYTAGAPPDAPVKLLATAFRDLPPGPNDFTLRFADRSEGRLRVMVDDTRMDARVNEPYSTAFGRRDEFYVPGFKADFALNENAFKGVRCGGRTLARGTDYETLGSVLTLSPAFSRGLLESGGHPELAVSFTSGADVVLKLNAETNRHITFYNARRSRDYTTDEMLFPYGFRDNNRVKAVRGDYQLTLYRDWLFRGRPERLTVRDGETLKLPAGDYRSFQAQRVAGPASP